MTNGQKLNVGLVFDDTLDSNDGVAQTVKNLGAWLTQRGHNVSYLVGETKLKDWAGAPVYSLAKNKTVRFNGNRLSMPLSARAKDIKAVLAAKDFDVLHITVPYSPLMGERVILMAEPKTAVVGTFHILPSGIMSKSGSKILGKMSWRSLKRMDSLTATSAAAGQFAKKTFGRDDGVIPNPVDIKKFKVPHKTRGEFDKKKIVFLGRLVKRKGAAQLIEAFAQLIKDGGEAELVIASDGPDRTKLKALVKHLGLHNRVKFLGYIAEADKPALLASADIACFPSLYGESFGIVLIEAMAAGSRTILAGDNPGYRSVMGEQPLTLINPSNSIVFAERLLHLLTDDELAKQLHSWQNQTVKQYDINVVGQQVEQLYFDAIARHTKKSNNKAHE